MSASSLGIDRWRDIIHELEGSSLATKDFAERHGLTASAVYEDECRKRKRATGTARLIDIAEKPENYSAAIA